MLFWYGPLTRVILKRDECVQAEEEARLKAEEEARLAKIAAKKAKIAAAKAAKNR